MNGTSFRRRCVLLVVVAFFICLGLLFLEPTNSEQFVHDQRISQLLRLGRNKSFCSERAARRGLDQHVLSVSAYESNDRVELLTNTTWNFITIFVREAKKLYPTWIVRVYHYNLRNKTKVDFDELESSYDNLDFCQVDNLPVLGDMRNKLPGKMQRFLPASMSHESPSSERGQAIVN
jgi:hypothetical protein